MLENLSVSELVAALIFLSAAAAAIATLTKPIRKALDRIKKLEDVVFDKDGNAVFPTKSEVDDIKQNTEEIKNAVNILCDAIVVMLDAQIVSGGDGNIEELKNAKARLQKKREIV